jgi:aminopeptidase N
LIQSKEVRLQDVIYWLAFSLSNPAARDYAWAWVKRNWRWLKDSLGHDISFPSIPLMVANNFNDIPALKDYSAFFKRMAEPSLKRSTRQGAEVIKLQSDWRHRDAEPLLKWLKSL